MLRQPQHKYPAFVPLALPDRQWPNQITRTPPVWLSTDLRDVVTRLVRATAPAHQISRVPRCTLMSGLAQIILSPASCAVFSVSA